MIVIRDKCNKVIGLISFETKNKEDFNVDVWIPSPAKKQAYFQHVVDSVLEWIEDYTDISRLCLRELTGNPRDNTYSVLKNYEIAVAV